MFPAKKFDATPGSAKDATAAIESWEERASKKDSRGASRSLHEVFQKRFFQSPTWKVESDPENKDRFRATILLPAPTEVAGEIPVTGDWVMGKAAAKESALKKVLGDVTVSAVASQIASSDADQDNGVSNLNESFQKTFKQSPKLKIERDQAKGLFRVATALPSGDPVVGDWVSSKSEAKMSALRLALSNAPSLLAEQVPKTKLAESSASASQPADAGKVMSTKISMTLQGQTDMPTLLQIYQQKFKLSPSWSVENHADKNGGFRASLKSPTGEEIYGEWAKGKAEAKRLALQAALVQLLALDGSEDQPGVDEKSKDSSIKPGVPVTYSIKPVGLEAGAEGDASAGGKTMVELHHEYHKAFRQSPNWTLEQSTDNKDTYRATIDLPTGVKVVGDWSRGKAEAKKNILEHPTIRNVIASKSYQ